MYNAREVDVSGFQKPDGGTQLPFTQGLAEFSQGSFTVSYTAKESKNHLRHQ
jgi:hypothetical protein